jgi:hypothetical protein
MTGQRTIHIRINDAKTGQPTPVRVRFTTADGQYLAPLGRLTEFATEPYRNVGGNLCLDDKRFAYIDGTCEVQAPAGPLLVEASKGPEYIPLRQEVPLGIGQLTVRLAIERWCDQRSNGWHAGDGRVHALTPHAALLEAAAEDVAVVNLLAEERHPADGPPEIPNILAFSGQRPALETPDHLVVVNTMNRHSSGRLALLNCHRIVYPLTAEGADWSLADWCDQCHRKGGLVVWANEGPLDGEALANLREGRIDAVEVCHPDIAPAIAEWYRLLDQGLHIPLIGSSGKDSNAVALGAVRTYAKLQEGESFSYHAWIEAVRAGRTFVTNGPLLHFTVSGQGPGAMMQARESLHLEAEARSWEAFDQLELVANGRVVARVRAQGSPPTARLSADVCSDQGSWLAARCWRQQSEGGAIYAHTGPVYIVETPTA